MTDTYMNDATRYLYARTYDIDDSDTLTLARVTA